MWQRATRCLGRASTERQARGSSPVTLSGCPPHQHGPWQQGFWNSNTFTVTRYKGPCTHSSIFALYRGTLLKISVFHGKLKLLRCKEKQTSPSTPGIILWFSLRVMSRTAEPQKYNLYEMASN